MTSALNPTISLVAFESRWPQFVFVAIPDTRGRYVRTHPCVITVPCGYCGAVVGEPCKGKTPDGYSGQVHVGRRDAHKRKLGRFATPKPRGDLVTKPHFRYVGPRTREESSDHG